MKQKCTFEAILKQFQNISKPFISFDREITFFGPTGTYMQANIIAFRKTNREKQSERD